jgi:hypothetical protein
VPFFFSGAPLDADGHLRGSASFVGPVEAAPADCQIDWDIAVTPSKSNHPPVATDDSWTVAAGSALDGNVLTDDRDPDGDAITPRVLKISFAAKEWSKFDADGAFLYTAGPGTTKQLTKTITYVAVDSHGLESKPAKAVITLVPSGRRAKRPPRGTSRRAKSRSALLNAAASTSPTWYGPFSHWAGLCFGSGLGSQCFYLLPVRSAASFDAATHWLPTAQAAAKMCLKFGVFPLKNADCARQLLQGGFGSVWNKSITRNARAFGDCLLYRIHRHRTVSHPFSGEWSKPELSTDTSLVEPYNGNPAFTGFATWTKGFSGKVRVPLFCDGRGLAYAELNQRLTDAP